MNVTVFGGSNPQPGSSAYEDACKLGRLLAMAGHTVLTGGYIGTMEAVSKGASEAGGHVVGVTSAAIEAWRGVGVNPWVQEERRFATLQERLNELILACDAAIALPGGPGTLTEIALTWNLMIIASIPRKPLILVGSNWKSVVEGFINSFAAYIPQNQRSLLQFARDVQTAVSLIQTKNN